MAKNVYISVILSFFITGLGNVYNGLVKRGAVEFVISLLLGFLASQIHWVIVFVALIFALYVLYDTYKCTVAINENDRIPLFLGKFELE